MSYSPLSSAFEGFRLIVRRPVSFLGWFLAVCLIAGLDVLIAFALRGPAAPVGGGIRVLRPAAGALAMMLGWADVFVGLTVVACAVYRAVLRPEERAFAYLRLGGGELRVMGVSALLVGFTVLLFVALSFSLTVFSAFLGAAAGPWATAIPGLLLLLAGTVLGVRLSMAGPIALIERRHSLSGSWELSRKRFWSLLGLWAIVGAVAFLVLLAVMGAVGFAVAAAPRSASGQLDGRTLTVVVATATYTVFFTLLTVLSAAAAAAAYRGLSAPEATPVEVFD
jgi:hypothetical protein